MWSLSLFAPTIFLQRYICHICDITQLWGWGAWRMGADDWMCVSKYAKPFHKIAGPENIQQMVANWEETRALLFLCLVEGPRGLAHWGRLKTGERPTIFNTSPRLAMAARHHVSHKILTNFVQHFQTENWNEWHWQSFYRLGAFLAFALVLNVLLQVWLWLLFLTQFILCLFSMVFRSFLEYSEYFTYKLCLSSICL